MLNSYAVILDSPRECDIAFIFAGMKRTKIADTNAWDTDGMMFDGNLAIVWACRDKCLANGIPKERIYVITNPSDLIAHRLKCNSVGEFLHEFRRANSMKDGHWLLDKKGYTNWGVVAECVDIVLRLSDENARSGSGSPEMEGRTFV